MATEFISWINKAGEDYGSLATWEAAIQSDLTSAQTRMYKVSAVTGTVADGATVTGQDNSYVATVRHVQVSGHTTRWVMVDHDTPAEVFGNNEQLQVDGSNYVDLTADAGDTDDTVVAVAELWDDDGALAKATWAGWDSDTTNRIIIRAASGEEHDGTVSSGGPVIQSAAHWDDLIDVGTFGAAGYILLQDIIIDHVNHAGRGITVANSDDDATGASTVLLERCILYGSAGGHASTELVFASTYGHVKLYNCLVYDCLGENMELASWGYLTVLNCTISDGVYGIRSSSSVHTPLVKNTIANNCTTNYGGSYGFAGASTHNISDGDATAPLGAVGPLGNITSADGPGQKLIDSGASFTSTASVGMRVKNTTDTTYSYVTAVDSDTQLTLNDNIFPDDDGDGYSLYHAFVRAVTFENEGADDFHLGSGDTSAKDQGTDLSGTFTDDIDGDTRSVPWDIGADQRPAAAGGNPWNAYAQMA